MQRESLHNVMKAFNEHRLKYAIVGGLAVNLYGYQRFTKDIDVIVSMYPDDLESLVRVLRGLGFRPIYPVSLDDFLVEETRRGWVELRNMTVFSVVSDRYPTITLDLFVDPPYSYAEIEGDLSYETVRDGLVLPTIDLDRLIQMKESVGRAQDVIDVEQLKKIRDEYVSRES